MGELRVGTSGFSYEDWRGHFYPDKIAKGDMLRYYAQRFQAVEVNSSFYVIPSPASFAGMAGKTPDGFEFAVKAPKDLTHCDEVQPEVCDWFRQAIEPVIESGKLGCILAQYPWSFKPSDANVDRVRQLRDGFGDLPVVVEFRNADWLGNNTFELLRENRLGFCCVDEPRLKGLIPGIVAATSNIGYVRFHGRNARKWWQHEQAFERYDYLYSEDELSEWIPKVRKLAAETEKTYLFFNNHYQGKAAQNARQFAGMLGVTIE